MTRIYKHLMFEDSCYKTFEMYSFSAKDTFILFYNIYVLQSVHQFTTLN
jgi:hypothetical protein